MKRNILVPILLAATIIFLIKAEEIRKIEMIDLKTFKQVPIFQQVFLRSVIETTQKLNYALNNP